MADSKKLLNASDDEMFKNLDVLLNLDELEESDFWDEMMNLVDLDPATEGGAKGSQN